MKRKIFFTFLLIVTVCGVTCCHAETSETLNMQEMPKNTLYSGPTAENFAVVPNSVRPWCYYWILKGNLTKDQITHDLGAMADKGFGGVLVFDSRYYYDEFDSKEHVPVPLHIQHEFMSEGWQELILFLIQEADRLGMRVSLNIADSGGMLRGPWDMGEYGPKELIWTEGNVDGPKSVSIPMTAPEEKRNYTDVALVALRITSAVAEGRETVKLNEEWENIQEPTPESAMVGETRDLRSFVKNGQLEWTVPEGHWKILRFGYHVVGDFGSVDILNETAIERYFRFFAEPILEKAKPYVGKTLTHFYNVSWEGSNPNWTPGMEELFAEWNGYEMMPYWGVLRGLCVENQEVSRRFLTDYYKTVSRCFQEHCYAKIGELCHERGIVWHSEDGGPWRRTAPIFRESDMLTFWGQNDAAQGEFWVNRNDATKTRSNIRFASMAANLHGQREVMCEAFTHMTKHWTMYPAWLKPAADVNFVDGMNAVVWHTFTASPPEQGMPGLEYFAGTHVNTNVTWFPYVGNFLTYLGRCQYLLRQGNYVVDVAAYVSDRNYVDWGRGEKWHEKADFGLPKGMKFDLMDTASLLKMEYQDGKLVLPSGMTYRALVIDPAEEELPVEALRKIETLKNAGAKIVFALSVPVRDRGLRNYPDGDAEMEEIVARIWKSEKFTSAQELEKKLALIPDFSGDFEFCHRKVNGTDIYFLSGTGTSRCTFRDGAENAQLWDAVSGKIRPITLTRSTDGRYETTLTLPQYGSIFVVFGSAEKMTEMVTETEKMPENETASETFFMLDSPWTVRFNTRMGAPAEVVWDTLTDWTQNKTETIRYYSGTATYTQKFTVSELPKTPISLSLGDVRYIARVRLNGQDLGVVWTAPWEIDVSRVLRTGENTLEIDVANTWANRLIGDVHLPPEKRFTRSNMYLYEKPGDIPEGGTRKFMPWQGFHKEDSPMPSGLLGPVELKR